MGWKKNTEVISPLSMWDFWKVFQVFKTALHSERTIYLQGCKMSILILKYNKICKVKPTYMLFFPSRCINHRASLKGCKIQP